MIIELERFIAVVERGSLTKTAKKLKITQPGLSFSIKRLEKALGIKLFKRVGKHLILTKEGESIYGIGLQIAKLWGRAKQLTSHDGNAPVYTIGLFDNAALKLSKYFQKNLAQNRFKFEITIDRSVVLLRGLHNGIFDICVCIIPFDKIFSPNAILIKKYSEKLLPVSKKILKQDISKIPFILYNKDSETRHYIDQVFLKKGIQPNVIVESTSPTFMKELAIGGVGLALLPKNFIIRELEQKKLFVQKLPFSFRREIGIFLNRDGEVSESNEVVKEIIKSLR